MAEVNGEVVEEVEVVDIKEAVVVDTRAVAVVAEGTGMVEEADRKEEVEEISLQEIQHHLELYLWRVGILRRVCGI